MTRYTLTLGAIVEADDYGKAFEKFAAALTVGTTHLVLLEATDHPDTGTLAVRPVTIGETFTVPAPAPEAECSECYEPTTHTDDNGNPICDDCWTLLCGGCELVKGSTLTTDDGALCAECRAPQCVGCWESIIDHDAHLTADGDAYCDGCWDGAGALAD